MRAGVNYIAADSPKEWIEAVHRLESDREFALTIAQRGRETYEQDFSIEAGRKRYSELTRHAIERFGARVPAPR